nr:MAG TPA: hypothetical protein [Caudoviricetes sp.]
MHPEGMPVLFSILFFSRQQCNPALSDSLPQKMRLINYFRRIPWRTFLRS